MSTDSTPGFEQLALAAPILKVIKEIGYEMPSPIQAESIPPLLEGRDLLGQAQTGTGKTAAFALPLLSRIDLSLKQPQILVLAPTRELAIQVAEAMQTYARHLKGFHVLPIYGGQSMELQLRPLRRGVHAVVGTPGRILDHLKRKTLKLDKLSAMVLDEADEMLRMGFIDDVELILEHTPAEKQVALFSATMPTVIRRVANQYLRDPVVISIKTKTTTVDTITQRYWQVSGMHKLEALTRMLEVEDFDAMIVFVRTKTSTVELAEKLEARGFSSSPLNGDMNQSLREKTVSRLKRGTLDIVVATDVAARGLDVGRISHVVNYDIPNDTEAYVHRIGRTGRAGKKGQAILFVSPREKRMLRSIEKATRQTITQMQLPSHQDVKNKRINQFKQKIAETIESQDLSFFEDLIAGYQEEHDNGLSEIGAALAYLVQRERPLNAKEQKRERATKRSFDDRNGNDSGRNERGRQEGRRSDSRRNERQPRRKPADMRPVEEGMCRYRIDVGHDHGVMPGNIVGAIANEAGLDANHIGQIKIQDDHSVVDLPDGMPKEIFQHLIKVRVCGEPLRIRLDSEKGSVEEGDGPPKKSRSGSKPAGDRKKPKTKPKSRKKEREKSSEKKSRKTIKLDEKPKKKVARKKVRASKEKRR